MVNSVTITILTRRNSYRTLQAALWHDDGVWDLIVLFYDEQVVTSLDGQRIADWIGYHLDDEFEHYANHAEHDEHIQLYFETAKL